MNDASAFRLETSGNRLIIVLLPKLNKVAWADIDSIGTEVLTRLSETSHPKILVDLCSLDYMGSAQLALIVRIFKAIKERAGAMVVANQHPVVQEVLTLAGLNKLWTIVTTRDEGLRLLGGDPGRSASSESHATSQSNSGTLVLVATVAAIISTVCLVAAFTQAKWLPSPASSWVACASAFAALSLATVAVLYARGFQKTLGTGVLLYGLTILLASVFAIAAPKTSSTTDQTAEAETEKPENAGEPEPAVAAPEVPGPQEPQTAEPEAAELPAKS
ncbi:STAS domain-containing protein [bacterium]|nr:STAS domain-containing protein [bacterium]